jgi:hypothetical protein
MKKQRLFRYLGIILIILPFLGLYQYMKTTICIVVGIVLILHSRNKSDKKVSGERTVSTIQTPTNLNLKTDTAESVKVK